MITFIICLSLLISAYFIYGRILEKICGIDPAVAVPSKTHYDGVDYIPMPMWKTFMIQLLNIAGLGPFFGAVLGAAYGPVAFVWITLGSILIGSVHDFVAGVMSVKCGGVSLPEVVGKYLGKGTLNFMRGFSVVLMIIVGAVFMSQPARLLAQHFSGTALDAQAFALFDPFTWIVLIFLGIIVVYYIIATLLPVDKIIGKFYPVFGIAILFAALGVLFALLFNPESYPIPELTSLKNMKASPEKFPIIPMLLSTISCGAISGFHGTQSPLMGRCLRNEKECRPVFMGAMIAEGVIALVWAAMAMSFWGGVEQLNAHIAEMGGQAAIMIDEISAGVFGKGASILVVVGVVACAITSGDTAFRSARLIVADFMRLDQAPMRNRLLICVPLFAIGLSFVFFVPFQIAWNSMAWTNQMLAVITLWAITAFLGSRGGKAYLLALIPAMLMTFVCSSYVFVARHMICLENRAMAYGIAAVITAVITACVLRKIYNDRKSNKTL